MNDGAGLSPRPKRLAAMPERRACGLDGFAIGRIAIRYMWLGAGCVGRRGMKSPALLVLSEGRGSPPGRSGSVSNALALFDSARRAWEPDLSAIGCAAVAGSSGAVRQAHRVCRICCRCAPDRRQARLPRPSGRSGSGVAMPSPLAGADRWQPCHRLRQKRIGGSHAIAFGRSGSVSNVLALLILPKGRGSLTCRRSAAQQS